MHNLPRFKTVGQVSHCYKTYVIGQTVNGHPMFWVPAKTIYQFTWTKTCKWIKMSPLYGKNRVEERLLVNLLPVDAGNVHARRQHKGIISDSLFQEYFPDFRQWHLPSWPLCVAAFTFIRFEDREQSLHWVSLHAPNFNTNDIDYINDENGEQPITFRPSTLHWYSISIIFVLSKYV